MRGDFVHTINTGEIDSENPVTMSAQIERRRIMLLVRPALFPPRRHRALADVDAVRQVAHERFHLLVQFADLLLTGPLTRSVAGMVNLSWIRLTCVLRQWSGA